ncbi:MAG: ROK family transcriptional regulator [Lachnospiraceae bacterium]|nr:ROK family transcriptional regulator [Lachnospiraceae bacterium]
MKRYLGLEDMSNVNCSNVLNIIREAGEISRKGISDESGLSWAGMTKIVNKLFEKGFLEESRSVVTNAGAGRIPNVIKICKDRNMIVGIDINREGFSGSVINLAGEVIKEYQSEIEYSNKDELLSKILSFFANIIKNHSHQKILAIGVAMQGELDVEKGISVKFPHCADWNNVPIKEILQNHFHYKVYVEHDPDCMLYSKIYKEVTDNSILFRMDRSIGMAVYLDGKILRGNGLLEVKNCIVSPRRKEGEEKKKVTIEDYISDCFREKEYHEEGMKELIPLLVNFMYNMGHIFHADRIILTGELLNHRDKFEEALLAEFAKYTADKEIKIVFMEETKRVVVGAALIAAQSAIDEIEV